MWKKSKNKKKICYVKIYPPIKLKQLSTIFILNHINNLSGPAKIYMTLLGPKIFQSSYFNYQIHFLDFCLLNYFCHLIAKQWHFIVWIPPLPPFKGGRVNFNYLLRIGGGGGESEKLKKEGGSMVQGRCSKKGSRGVWHFS